MKLPVSSLPDIRKYSLGLYRSQMCRDVLKVMMSR